MGVRFGAGVQGAVAYFEESKDGTTWNPIHNIAGDRFEVAINAGAFVPFAPLELQGVTRLRILTRVAGGGSAQTQAAERSIDVITRQVYQA